MLMRLLDQATGETLERHAITAIEAVENDRARYRIVGPAPSRVVRAPKPIPQPLEFSGPSDHSRLPVPKPPRLRRSRRRG